jgi:2-keto-4-pentenoate hydratase/2-oxohepta-3-ene-1,7-dioic acid hydratase in catechol pathway
MSKLKVKNSDETIEVENVYCVGKNYLDHIKELDNPGAAASIPTEPVIFLKPNTAVLSDSKTVSVPEYKGRYISNDLQNEVELVVVIGKEGISVSVENIFSYVYGYAVGIDFTLRDIQSDMKKKGLPWTLSKGFLTSAPVSEVVKRENVGDIQNLAISLKINGKEKQRANTSQMIFNVDYIIHYISCIFGLRKGDMIFTGTPAGVTKLYKGDKISAEIESIGTLDITYE